LTVNRKLILPPFFFIVLNILFLMSPVNAEGINLTGFPEQLAEATKMSLFASQILCSVIFCFTWLIALNATEKGSGLIPNLIVGIGCLCFCVAIGWLGVWVLILVCLMIASLWSGRIAEFLGRK